MMSQNDVKFTSLNINVSFVSLKITTVFYPMDSICSIHQRCSREKLFLKISQYSQKITFVGVSLLLHFVMFEVTSIKQKFELHLGNVDKTFGKA